jgi:mRNA-degrading endonuclease toxin of MazEF toxin-antitoxin module
VATKTRIVRIGFVALDQLRTVDVERLVKRFGQLEGETVLVVLQGFQEMFAE